MASTPETAPHQPGDRDEPGKRPDEIVPDQGDTSHPSAPDEIAPGREDFDQPGETPSEVPPQTMTPPD